MGIKLAWFHLIVVLPTKAFCILSYLHKYNFLHVLHKYKPLFGIFQPSTKTKNCNIYLAALTFLAICLLLIIIKRYLFHHVSVTNKLFVHPLTSYIKKTWIFERSVINMMYLYDGIPEAFSRSSHDHFFVVIHLTCIFLQFVFNLSNEWLAMTSVSTNQIP